jgi:hypothetical protein
MIPRNVGILYSFGNGSEHEAFKPVSPFKTHTYVLLHGPPANGHVSKEAPRPSLQTAPPSPPTPPTAWGRVLGYRQRVGDYGSDDVCLILLGHCKVNY